MELIKKTLIPTLEYGTEIFNLNKKDTTTINKKLASLYRQCLDLDSYTPTKWVLWEVNQTQIEWTVAKRQTAYWWKVITTQDNTKNNNIQQIPIQPNTLKQPDCKIACTTKQ